MIPAASGNPLTDDLVSNPANGQLTLNADGTFSYTPNAGFWGNNVLHIGRSMAWPPPIRPR